LITSTILTLFVLPAITGMVLRRRSNRQLAAAIVQVEPT
jgi:Cu/Ag efflux pump CusA